MRKRLTGRPETSKSAINGYDNEGLQGDQEKSGAPEGSGQGIHMQVEQKVALDKHSELPSGGQSSVLSETRSTSPLGAVQEDISTTLCSDTDLPKWLESHKRRHSRVNSTSQTQQKEKVLKLTPKKIHELTSGPNSLPLRPLASADPSYKSSNLPESPFNLSSGSQSEDNADFATVWEGDVAIAAAARIGKKDASATKQHTSSLSPESVLGQDRLLRVPRPTYSARAASSPSVINRTHSSQSQLGTTARRGSKRTPPPPPPPLTFGDQRAAAPHVSDMEAVIPSPMPKTIPLPPMSLSTYLQLELSSHRPSPLYIHRSVASDFPYESSRVKLERLLNFLLLPPQLEQVLWFGTFACLDAWLYTFTILPLRLLKSLYILGQSWATNLAAEAQYVFSFIYAGTGRMWKRRRTRGSSASKANLERTSTTLPERLGKLESTDLNGSIGGPRGKRRSSLNKRNVSDGSARKARRVRKTKSVPSSLLPDDKADILEGLLIISTCLLLMRLDASRMYHWIRGQAAIKLYVIYNVLEVGDRLLSAIGQDVIECLFSREALERGPDGHSKVLRPFWLFLLALTYTVVHATALFYQVITLNVAVNSYSNALITLLMSNQFVEIKSTVFKKFEKENLFQLTCADVVERFQLWLMLLIIASRNIVETGGLGAGLSMFSSSSSSFTPTATNSSNPLDQLPRSAASILPRSFTLLPNILSSLTAYAPPGIGHVLGPFLVVLGSEMLVDWLKHSYINKFNNTRPAIYGRFLDVLAKDYYSNAFADQNLTKRLGLPVIPLSCLFIRASVQTYHMFLAAWIPPTLPSSGTGLTSAHNHYSSSATSVPTSTAAALSQRFDDLLRQIPASIASTRASSNFNTILIFLLMFLVLLTVKLVLGMLLLAFSRSRYRSMKEREKNPIHHVEGGRRVGGWGVVEVDEDKRRWIYDGDPEGARQFREREEHEKARRDKGVGGSALERVKRYEMVAKRIW